MKIHRNSKKNHLYIFTENPNIGNVFKGDYINLLFTVSELSVIVALLE